jgi:hypothetical protein
VRTKHSKNLAKFADSPTLVCGSLELATKNIVTGSVRMVYAIIYSLFLVSDSTRYVVSFH